MVYRPLAKRLEFSSVRRFPSYARDQTAKKLGTRVSSRDAEDVPPQVRLAAANMIMTWAWGRPREVELGEDGEPRTLRIVHEYVHVQKTQEELEHEDLVVDYTELRSNGN